MTRSFHDQLFINILTVQTCGGRHAEAVAVVCVLPRHPCSAAHVRDNSLNGVVANGVAKDWPPPTTQTLFYMTGVETLTQVCRRGHQQFQLG